MKAATHEWLSHASDDVAAVELLLQEPHLANVVSFHAQQAVEKSLKAVIEELELGLVKTHSLARLNEMIKPYGLIIEDMDMLDRLDAVYIETRYPGDLGLLPGGKPTLEEAVRFGNFAREVYQRTRAAIESGTLRATDMPGGVGSAEAGKMA